MISELTGQPSLFELMQSCGHTLTPFFWAQVGNIGIYLTAAGLI